MVLCFTDILKCNCIFIALIIEKPRPSEILIWKIVREKEPKLKKMKMKIFKVLSKIARGCKI